MKKTTELDVDFIGGQGPLTKAEEQAISEYIRTHKAKRVHKRAAGKRTGRTTSRKKAVA